MSKTSKYVVIKPHTLNHKIGAVIELTEAKAKALIGKIRLQAEIVGEAEFLAENGNLKTKNAELITQVEALELENGKLKKEIDVLTQQLKKAK